MFCSKCGNEIMNEAVVCPHCGCATNNYVEHRNSTASATTFSENYQIIKQFAAKANTMRTLGIFAAIFMFGVGLIFSIIIWIQGNANKIPELQLEDPKEISEFEAAKKAYNLAFNLSGLPLIGLGLCFLIGFIVTALGAY